MPPRRGCHLPVADKTFPDDPELVIIRPTTADGEHHLRQRELRFKDDK